MIGQKFWDFLGVFTHEDDMLSRSPNPPPSYTQEEMAEARNRGFREQLIGQALVGLLSGPTPISQIPVDRVADDAINLADTIIRKLEMSDALARKETP